MKNNEGNQSFKKLVELTLRYDKNQIIHPNPDKANKTEEEFVLEKIPDLVRILINGKPKERVHVAFGLKNLSEEKRFRIPLCICADFIEAICSLFYIEENTDITRRCQLHGLAILNNLLLESPTTDAFIANDEFMLPGLVKMLSSDHKHIQEQAAKCLHSVSVNEENQTLVCTTEGLLAAVVHLLRNTKSNETRNHVLQALVLLSSNHKNLFTIAREKGMLDALKDCLATEKDLSTIEKATQILYHLCLLKENIPLIAKNSDLYFIVKAKNDEVQHRLQNSDNQYKGFESDVIAFKLTGIILDMIYTYETRLNNKVILRGEGFNGSEIAIGNHLSKTMIKSSTSISESIEEDVFN